MLFNYYSLNVEYKKEKYTFLPNKIIRSGGGIFSEYEVELVVRNITHITMRLPFVENKLFQTGNIKIESAGTGAAEVFLSSLDGPDKIYEYIANVMKYNGFKLSKSKLIQKESPSSLGVFFEVFKNFLTFILFIIGIGSFVIAGFESENIKIFSFNTTMFFIIGIVLFLFFWLFFNFLELKNRIYNLYSDTITYEEGFLSKNYSFIPIENLSDSTLTQSLVDKIFGLYDVKISCQGTAQEVHFKNMVNGPKLESNIDNLISKTNSLVGTEKKIKKVEVKKESTYKPKSLGVDTKFTAEYRMDSKRTYIPCLFIFVILILAILLLPAILTINKLGKNSFGFSIVMFIMPLVFSIIVFLFLIIPRVIKLNATRYIIKSRSVEEKYNFISQKNVEFSNEKIMTVLFKENFIDKWFNTCSIHFWSIGSAQDIKFTNIKKTEELYKSILSKSGIKIQNELYPMNSNFIISELFKASFFITLTSIAIIIGTIWGSVAINKLFLVPLSLLVFIYIVTIIYNSIYYNRSKLTFYKDFVYFTKGIFFKEFYYALYDNIKDITTVKYPFSRFGTIKFNVAGEHLIQKQNQHQLESNHFKINYIKDIDIKDELIDTIFYKRPTAQQINQIEKDSTIYSLKPILVSKPSLANPLFGLIITSIIIFPLIALLPITLILVIWSTKVKSFIIQPYRVVSKSGILYKKQISIVFNKVDHINSSQGMLNKMFHNGNITVNTTGSSMPELIINNVPNYKEFYDVLKRYY